MKDLYSENYEPLLKEIEDTNKWKYILCLWVGRINSVKMAVLYKAICKFHIVTIKMPKAFFTEIEEKKLKVYVDPQKTLNSQRNPEEKIKLKVSYLGILIKTIFYWHKNKHIDQWNRIESPELNSRMYCQLIFNKGAKNTQWGKDSLFNKWCWENWRNACRTMKLEPSFTKINPKWIKDLKDLIL